MSSSETVEPVAASDTECERELRAPDRSRPALSWRVATPWLLLCGIDLLLFVPSYVCSQPVAELMPLLPSAHARSLAESLQQLFVSRANLDVFRISVDLVVLTCLAVLSARSRLRALPRVLAALYVVGLLVFLSYHHAVSHYFVRVPALKEDIRLALNLGHLASSMLAPWQLGLAVVVIVIGLVWLGLTSAMALGAIQAQATRWTLRGRAWSCGLACLPLLVSLSTFGLDSDEPVVQLLGKRAFYNWRASHAQTLRLAELREPNPDRRYQVYRTIELARKPTFLLLMIESYGEILSTWDMEPAYRDLMERVQQRLSAAGYHARSIYSAAPVYGGTSWFSIATVQTGISIDRPVAHTALEEVGATVPSLTRFFADQGYPTYTLQPGTTGRSRLGTKDMLEHDVVLNRMALGYTGPKFGWGVVPDQYSLGVYRERFPMEPGVPRFLFYMSVSTHFPWGAGVPPYVGDWRALERGEVQPAGADPSWPELRGMQAIGTDKRRSYMRSVDYEFRLLTEWLEAEPEQDIVVLIVGDHQPRLEWDVPGLISMNAPVHVLSRDPELVERFAAFDFQPGMFVDPAQDRPMDHAGILSLMISQLTAAYGEPGSPELPYHPHGIRLSGLQP